jgi:hypothetical protein
LKTVLGLDRFLDFALEYISALDPKLASEVFIPRISMSSYIFRVCA